MVTIKDIAKAAGVSHTTVSRALNNNPLIKEATRKKIQALAAEMNYSPNFNAKSLVNQKNYMIGLFFSSIEDGTSSSFLTDAITGIHSVLKESFALSVEAIDEITAPQLINFQRYDGIIVMSQSDSDTPFIQHIKRQNIPLVVVNRQLDDDEIINVVANDAAGVTEAIDYAIECSHQEIGFIGGISNFRSSKEREQGLRKSLEKHSIQAEPNYFFNGDYSIHSGFIEMQKILKLDKKPTVVFCANDDMAIGAIRAVDQSGLNVPQDISVIGFDDSLFVSYLNPPLTTVHKPLKKICQKGTQLLLSLINGQKPEQHLYRLTTSLKIRQSVAKLAKSE